MSRLDDLLSAFCPNGVEYKMLSECCLLEKGKTAIQKATPGEYPLVVTTSERKTANTFQFDGPTVCVPLVSSRGHGVACLNAVFYQEGKFALGNILCGITPFADSGLSAKFLYYYLNLKKDKLIVPLMKGGANVSLTVNSLKTVRMPIPPIEVQKEIIKRIDKFDELQVELSQELDVRRKQYEYYRNYLINRGSHKKVALKSVVKRCCSGSTPKKSCSEYYENGTIPWLRTQDVVFNEITKVNSFITEEAVNRTSVKWIPENCVIVAISGASAGRCAINKFPTTTNQHCLNLEIDESKALYKYIFYCVWNGYEELLEKKQGARGDLNATLIQSLEIPLPPIQEQKRIVEVLDKFALLCDDTSEGLPAVIKVRQKQYEYYRDKLLDFNNRFF